MIFMGLPFKPTRSCAKNTGLPENIRIKGMTINHIGRLRISRIKARIKSNILFIFYDVLI
jgi:hypothetical protein